MNFIQRGEGARLCIREGITEFGRGNFGNALKRFEEALRANPESVVALQYRGICKCLLAINTNMSVVRKDRKVSEALSDFRKVAGIFDKFGSHPLFRNRYF